MDYFKSDAAPRGNLTGLDVWDAILKSREWTEQLARKTEDEETSEDINVIATYGSFSWVELLSEKALKKETHYMAHCVGDPGMGYLKKIKNSKIKIYSLRDSANKPHCTLTFDLTNKEINELSGKGNGPVDSKYVPLVKRFLEDEIHPKYVNTGNLPGLFWDDDKGRVVEAYEVPLAKLFYLLYEDILIEGFSPDEMGEIIKKHGENGTINQVWDKAARATYPTKFNALWFAVYRWGDRPLGNLRVAQIVEAGGKDMSTTKGTALAWAIRRDYRNIIEILLTNKASDPSGISDFGVPLFVELLSGNNYEEEIVDLFLDCPDLDLELMDNRGRTAIFYTCSFQNAKTTEKLLKRGANTNNLYDRNSTFTEFSVPASFGDKYSLLDIAALNYDIAMLKVLKDYIDLKKFGPRALKLAMTVRPGGGDFDVQLSGYLKKAGIEVSQ